MSNNQTNPQIATPKGVVWRDEKSIYHIDYEERAYLDKEDVELQQNAIQELEGTPQATHLVLINGSNARGIDAEARQFIHEQDFRAVAIVVKSAISRLVFNFLKDDYKPAYPVKLFRDEKSATDWLLGVNK